MLTPQEQERVDKNLKTLNKELAHSEPTSARLCQYLTDRLADCGLTIDWSDPASLELGKSASFRLLQYHNLFPYPYILTVKKINDGKWSSEVTFTEC